MIGGGGFSPGGIYSGGGFVPGGFDPTLGKWNGDNNWILLYQPIRMCSYNIFFLFMYYNLLLYQNLEAPQSRDHLIWGISCQRL